MKLLKEYVKRTLYTNYSNNVCFNDSQCGLPSSELVLQIREEGFDKYLAPDSIYKAIAELFSEGLVNINPDSGVYCCSNKLINSLAGDT